MERSLPDFIEAHARTAPSSVAITAGGRHYSYGQLWRGALSFAAWLERSGFRPGNRVAVLLPNCPEAVIACYGTWMAGGVAVPLNDQARPPELGPWLRHCEPAALVCERAHADAVSMFDSALLPSVRAVLDDRADRPGGSRLDAAIPGGAGATRAEVTAAADDSPAMILYTSGTTGSPKGVTLSHRNLASNAASINRYLGLSAADSVVSVLPFYYAYGCSVLNTHLMAGGRLVIESNMVFPHAVVETMACERVSGFSGVPSTFALLLSRVDLRGHDLGSLRYVTQAGGPMPVAMTERLLAAIPNARLFVMYGQTEATARLTSLPPEMLRRKLGSVGLPIQGVEIEIRSEDGRAAETNCIGEVWARGANVMLGYWRDETQTSEVLSDGWLKTGDMGRVDGDGFLFLEGRRTDMIKVGAHRIYPKDVEEAIAELPGIAEVAVVGVDDEILGQVIKAYVVPSAASRLDAMSVQAHCRERLAPYKIPRHVEFVQALPRTASGKVMRRALMRPAAAAGES